MAPTKPRAPKPKSQSDQIRELQTAPKAGKPGERKDDGTPKNNLQAIREAEEKSLHKLLADVRALQGPLEEAQAVVKTRREAVNKRLDQGVADGHPKGLVRKMLAETAVTGERKNQREEWEREVRYREYLGLPARTQSDMEDRIPEAAKDEQDWRGSGYTAGLRADEPNPQKAGVPPRFHQAWMEEWHNGQAKNALALGKPKIAAVGDAPAGDLGAEVLDAIGEAEPEIVAQTVADHGDDADAARVAEQRAADEEAFDQEPANSEPV